jgi:predicted TIM-barrel fold metal-dependent hydrolase
MGLGRADFAEERGTAPHAGAIDCDLHPAVRSIADLAPYLDGHWRDQVVARGIDGLGSASFPPTASAMCRPDWRLDGRIPGSDVDRLLADGVDAFGSRFAILNCLYGVQAVHDEYLAAALCRAVNEWIAREWLDRDPRLRAAIVIAPQNIALAVEEIERRIDDPRFVQILMIAISEMPLGRRHYWPIYEAAERYGLPVAVHAGSNYGRAPTGNGLPSFFLEEYVSFTEAFQAQALSLVAEGALTKFPGLTVVFAEAGFAWLPTFMWRADKTWKAMRIETPWVEEPPSAILRRQLRVTLQPSGLPPDPATVEKVIAQIDGDDMLLFSTDYPHWHFDGTAALPPGLPPDLARKLCVENPLMTYPRLGEVPAS